MFILGTYVINFFNVILNQNAIIKYKTNTTIHYSFCNKSDCDEEYDPVFIGDIINIDININVNIGTIINKIKYISGLKNICIYLTCYIFISLHTKIKFSNTLYTFDQRTMLKSYKMLYIYHYNLIHNFILYKIVNMLRISRYTPIFMYFTHHIINSFHIISMNATIIHNSYQIIFIILFHTISKLVIYLIHTLMLGILPLFLEPGCILMMLIFQNFKINYGSTNETAHT